jgi:ATP-dependent Clp protease ATP-binding subunit ClpC
VRLKREFIGTEHILLGIFMQDGPAARILKDHQIDLKRVRQAVEKLVPPTSAATDTFGQIPFSPHCKRAIELAADEADRLGHEVIVAEHLLIGLVVRGEGTAAGVLKSLGIDLESLRAKVLEAIGGASKENSDTRTGGERDASLSGRAQRVMRAAIQLAGMKRADSVTPEHLLWAILWEQGPAAEFLDGYGIRKEDVEGLLDQPRG